MGPPKAAPNWLRLRDGRATQPVSPRKVHWGFVVYWKTSAAAILERLNQYAAPCIWLVPDLVATWMTAPPARPNSAGATLVVVLNSATSSIAGKITIVLTSDSLLSMPSIM